MKNIKKYLVVAFAFLVTLSITGCGTKSAKSSLKPAEAFEKSREAAKTVENYKAEIKMTIGMDLSAFLPEGSTESGIMEAKISYSMKIDDKNKKAELKIVTESEGEKQEQEGYLDYTDETNSITYIKENGNWIKSVSSTINTNTLSSMQDLGNGEIKEIDADSNNYNYEVTIKKEDLNKVFAAMGSSGAVDETVSSLIGSINGDIKVIVSLDKTTYNISKVKMDLMDLLKDVNVYGIKYTKADFEVAISDYDKVGTITIPEDALNVATAETETEEDIGTTETEEDIGTTETEEDIETTKTEEDIETTKTEEE